jgi:hypothetical protein
MLSPKESHHNNDRPRDDDDVTSTDASKEDVLMRKLYLEALLQ